MEELNKILKGHVQKIYACPFFYSFKIRTPGKTWYLYVGKGRYAQNIFISEKRIEGQHRRKDSYLEKMKKELLGSCLAKVWEDSGFYLLCFKKAGLEKTIFFSYRENLLYTGLIQPYKAEEIEAYLLYHRRSHQRYVKDSFNLAKFLKDQNRILPKVININSISDEMDPSKLIENYQQRIWKKKSKKEKIKIVRIKEDLKRLTNFLELKIMLSQHRPIDTYINNQTFSFENIKVRKIPADYYKARDLLFKKIKNIEIAIRIQNDRLNRLKLSSSKEEVDVTTYVFPVIKKIDDLSAKNDLVFSPSNLDDFGLYIIGRNSKENDQLRTKWAKPMDYWFHFKDRPGPHLFLRLFEGNYLTPDILELVCRALAKHASNSIREINIIYTRVKYLKKVSGTQGKLIPKNEKSYRSLL